SPAMKAGLLDAAARDAERIGRQKLELTRPVSRLFGAGGAALQGRRGCAPPLGGRPDRALQALGEASDGFEKLDMALHAAAARWRRGQLLGGDEGGSLEAAAGAYMRAQTIEKPDRIVALLA